MACTKVMSAPVCLIDTDVNGMLCVRKEAKDILDGITEPVVVVSVVGLYRTGKSYLMNRLAGQQSGFALGNTIESKTKGIWMWCVPHPSKAGHTLVLLDTEGLGDVDKIWGSPHSAGMTPLGLVICQNARSSHSDVHKRWNKVMGWLICGKR